MEGWIDLVEGVNWYEPNSDWNQLMLVFDVIESMGYKVLSDIHQCQVWNKNPSKEEINELGDLAGFIIDADFHEDRKQNAWDAIVGFIEWYNDKIKIQSSAGVVLPT